MPIHCVIAHEANKRWMGCATAGIFAYTKVMPVTILNTIIPVSANILFFIAAIFLQYQAIYNAVTNTSHEKLRCKRNPKG